MLIQIPIKLATKPEVDRCPLILAMFRVWHIFGAFLLFQTALGDAVSQRNLGRAFVRIYFVKLLRLFWSCLFTWCPIVETDRPRSDFVCVCCLLVAQLAIKCMNEESTNSGWNRLMDFTCTREILIQILFRVCGGIN